MEKLTLTTSKIFLLAWHPTKEFNLEVKAIKKHTWNHCYSLKDQMDNEKDFTKNLSKSKSKGKYRLNRGSVEKEQERFCKR